MKISIDTKEDSHDDIRKVIRMLQNLVGDSQEVFTNQPELNSEATSSPFTNIFGDTNASSQELISTPETAQEQTSESTEDLFAELFSEEELKKMNQAEVKDNEEEEEIKPRGKKFNIELY